MVNCLFCNADSLVARSTFYSLLDVIFFFFNLKIAALQNLLFSVKPQHESAIGIVRTLMLGEIDGRRRRGATEDEMAGWHHQLYGHEFEQAPGVGDGQGSLVSSSLEVARSWRQLSD